MRRFTSPEYKHREVVIVDASEKNADASEGGSKPRIVLFCVWDLSYEKKRVQGPSYSPKSRKKLASSRHLLIDRVSAILRLSARNPRRHRSLGLPSKKYQPNTCGSVLGRSEVNQGEML